MEHLESENVLGSLLDLLDVLGHLFSPSSVVLTFTVKGFLGRSPAAQPSPGWAGGSCPAREGQPPQPSSHQPETQGDTCALAQWPGWRGP